jgi:hypothetical protein
MALGTGTNDTPVRFVMGCPVVLSYRQWAAVRTVRELMSEPVHPEFSDPTLGN